MTIRYSFQRKEPISARGLLLPGEVLGRALAQNAELHPEVLAAWRAVYRAPATFWDL